LIWHRRFLLFAESHSWCVGFCFVHNKDFFLNPSLCERRVSFPLGDFYLFGLFTLRILHILLCNMTIFKTKLKQSVRKKDVHVIFYVLFALWLIFYTNVVFIFYLPCLLCHHFACKMKKWCPAKCCNEIL
jgi:hypothetical protein